MFGKSWSRDEDDFLRLNYPILSAREISIVLNRGLQSIRHRIITLGLVQYKPTLIGEKFGRLTILEIFYKQGKYQQNSFVKCKCDCGNEKVLSLSEIKRGKTSSCGCLRKEISKLSKYKTHGMTKSRLYSIWKCMKSRCYRKKHHSYKDYGGRGIIICNEWKNSFENFRDWALVNGYQDNLEIDRKDVNGNYYPENCRFVTDTVQANNKRNTQSLTAFGESKTFYEWTLDTRCVVSHEILRDRVNVLKWDAEVAITTLPRNNP